MRLHPLHLALASSLVLSYVASSSTPDDALGLIARDGGEHGHHHGVAPLLELNETEVTLYHSPTPPSYYTIDWEDSDQVPGSRHPSLIITHSVFMSLAFFGFLPMAITLRSLNHAWRGIAVFSFYTSFILACAASSVYRKLTPDMYVGSSHARHGYNILLIALGLTAIDTFDAFRRLISFLRSGKHYTLKGIAPRLLGREENDKTSGPEYIGLMGDEDANFHRGNTEQWANHVRSHSTMSDGTLFGPSSPHSEATLHDVHISSSQISSKISLLRRLGRAAFAATERALVFAGFAMLLTGIVIYTGGCRENYINGFFSRAEGGIFWCYGLISFARFLGWCSELGWSWNRAPSSAGYPTAEMVESTVIFLYGATNTWMERFGANPGDPYTTKQLQHIGIAVMFWFAGLVVFNPFPALVIGVTGSVMAAHFQTYLFQVQIHSLWGNLLVAFAVLRCLTYFFVWVAPPRSTLPFGSFFLAAGGLSFIFSTEEVTLMAMRRGRDDIMMFAVVAVAITCLAFTWIIWVVGFHGWLKARTKRIVRAVSYNNPA
ncbi:hypothetical protein R3P38DRAFT_2830402 [Favolaschia claudopus]|uniref:Cytoplasmic protein n=1 Tax=Favolaschia claudopus TaxID=2862362 RepID=A0AAW0EBJ3_9AGAR